MKRSDEHTRSESVWLWARGAPMSFASSCAKPPVVTIGAGIGVALALAASRLIGSLLFGIAPSDPFAIGSALAVLIGVALAASYLPARRASQLDPTQALRYE